MNEDAFAFWFNGIASCIVALVGLCMNIISIYILYKKTTSNMFNHLLMVLFGIDSIVLFTSILWDMALNLQLENISFLILIYPYLTYPVNSIAMMASTFMTIAIAHDRYLATKHPIRHSQHTKEESDRRKRLLKYLVPIMIVAILFNVPTFFEFGTIYAPPVLHECLETECMKHTLITQKSVNDKSVLKKCLETECSKHILIAQTSVTLEMPMLLQNNSLSNGQNSSEVYKLNLWENMERVPSIYVSRIAFKHIYNFDRIYHWTSLMLAGIIPFLMLSFFNFKIYQQVMVHSKSFSQQHNFRDSKKSIGNVFVNEQSKRKEEVEMSKVLIGIVVVFLLCHTLKNACDVIWGLSMFFSRIDANDMAKGRGKYEIVCGVGKFLGIVNSSVNMIIYCFINKKFRHNCLEHAKKCVYTIRCNKGTNSQHHQQKRGRNNLELF